MKNVVIIPTYNERENILNIIPKIFSFVPDIFVLVTDDNSPDKTSQAVLDLKIKYPHVSLLAREKKEGLGKAYINAFTEVLKDRDVHSIIMMDADLSHDPMYLPEMIKRNQKFDVVLGSRYVDGGATVGWEFWRKALSYFGNMYARVVAGLPVHDCTGGFNAIRVEKLRELNLDAVNVSGYAFIMGLKFLLAKNGATFSEIPIIFHNRREGESKMSGHAIARYFNEGILAPWKMRWKMISKK